MNIYQQRQKTKSHAMMTAARTLERLGIAQSQPIDIFRVIQEEGIWLMFQPLKNLYGFYLKEGNAAGIQINSKHPLKLQRYTAAHEYAHHILGHSTSLDDAAYIERAYSSSNLQELAADTFAAYFLMPPQLVNTLLKRMGLLRVGRPLTSIEVYRLSLEMGASYAATVNHLAALDIVTSEDVERLRLIRPKQIKAQLQSQPLENSWAEIWVLDQADSGKELRLRVYDDLKISLPENPTTGYIWTFDEAVVQYSGLTVGTAPELSGQESDLQQSLFGLSSPQGTPHPLMMVYNDFEANSSSEDQKIYGSGGNRYFTVRTLLPGHHVLRLLERRPWEEEADAQQSEWLIFRNSWGERWGEAGYGFIKFEYIKLDGCMAFVVEI